MLNIDLRRAFTYAFADKHWVVKLGLLLLIGLVPGLDVIAWVGYQVSIAHNVARNMRDPLPSWDDWADIFVRGLMTILAGFIYFLPVLIGGCLYSVIALIGRGSSGLLIALRCCTGVGILLYGLFALLLLSVGAAQYARTDQYNVFFAFGARLRDLSSHLSVYGVGFVYQALLALFGAILLPLSIFTIIGPFLIGTAFSVINGHFLGNVAQRITPESLPARTYPS